MKLNAKNWKVEFEKADVYIDHIHEGQYCYHRWTILSPIKVKSFISHLLQSVIKDLAGEELEYKPPIGEFDEELNAIYKGFNQHRQEVLERGKKWTK